MNQPSPTAGTIFQYIGMHMFGSTYKLCMHMGPVRPGFCLHTTCKYKAGSLKVQKSRRTRKFKPELKLQVLLLMDAKRSRSAVEPSSIRNHAIVAASK